MSNKGPVEPDHHHGSNAGRRVGNAERDAVIALLEEHWQAGRLDPAEHELRVTKARAAVTQADLDGLFTDLPRPGRTTDSVNAQSSEVAAIGRSAGFLERRRDTIMALMPFAAVFLFFTTHAWLWFLTVPVAGILLYAGDDGKRDAEKGKKRRRQRDR